MSTPVPGEPFNIQQKCSTTSHDWEWLHCLAKNCHRKGNILALMLILAFFLVVQSLRIPHFCD